MALLAGGRERIGETAIVDVGGRDVRATITPPVFFDPENRRRDG